MSLRLASPFTDHAVLQRDRAVPVWGTDRPGQRVVVRVAGREASAVADDAGRWSVSLPAMPAGGPFEMVITGSEVVTLRDILVGEVWLCSGQSNMQWSVIDSANADQEIACSDHPRLRMFSAARVVADEPRTHVPGKWEVSSPATSAQFSAVAYYFGRELLNQLDVPIGLIHSSWGGTVAEAWTSREALVAEPVLKPMIDRCDAGRANWPAVSAAYAKVLADWEKTHIKADPGDVGHAQGWTDPARAQAEGDWDTTMSVPRYWQAHGLVFSGVVWFRRWVDVPAAWAGCDLELSLGACDKADWSYWNGRSVGSVNMENSTESWMVQRQYRVPGSQVKAGRNLVAVRIYSHQYAGGFAGPATRMKVFPVGRPDEAIPLDGTWQYKVEHNFGQVPPPPPAPLGPGNQNMPTGLFNAMIAPLVPYAIRGATWYQGESNAGRAREYRTLLPTLIRDWRHRWNDPSQPFLIVQLANFRARFDQPVDDPWAYLREAQFQTLGVPHTGMAVTIDLGDANDIHPRNKQDVGKRLAAWALGVVYDRSDVVPSGPLYRGARRDGANMRIEFDHIAGGLICQGTRLEGFTIAGPDREWHWADARIDGDSVVVESPAVPDPIAVRYGWTNNPACNLYNAAHLPASPFRTDDWASVMEGA